MTTLTDAISEIKADIKAAEEEAECFQAIADELTAEKEALIKQLLELEKKLEENHAAIG